MIAIDGRECLTADEVAELKAVSLSTVRKAVREGRLESVKVAGRVWVLRSSAEAYQPANWGGIPGRAKVTRGARGTRGKA